MSNKKENKKNIQGSGEAKMSAHGIFFPVHCQKHVVPFQPGAFCTVELNTKNKKQNRRRPVAKGHREHS
jgi:hypothetical protein